jgi:hypothetical protein
MPLLPVASVYGVVFLLVLVFFAGLLLGEVLWKR